MQEIAGVFHSYADLLDAAQKIQDQTGMAEEDIHVSHSNRHTPIDYDPLGPARFTNSLMGTMAGSGPNLVGNSVTIDVELSQLPEILEANAEAGSDDHQRSYLLTVLTFQDEVPLIEQIISESGGEKVEISHSNV